MELKCVRVWLMLMLMFISFEGWMIEGCLDEERSALLQLKHFFNDPYSLLDWVEGDRNLSYCCQWTRIQCNNMTDRVTSISLSDARKYESGEWNLNVSLFSPFQELETLYLGGNLIADCVENEGFEKLSHLSNLKSLYLYDNMFNDSRILSALSEHLSLKYLDLSYNQFRELNHFNELVSLSNLEALFMGGNEINKIVFSKGGTSLRKLNWLHLWNVSISDGSSLLQTLGSLPSLNYVELWYCNISGRLPIHGLSVFQNLTRLYIFETVFHNNIFQMLGDMTSLQSIIIWDSNFDDVLFDQG
ncbi:receptor-like protein 13 [Mangifera indica]|uniref:receptor-like protein 13 n=1 Tax=Mangifera indica TaxID=29780 RepID=UPI001CFA0C31|nr:receptor-like protein 13 [Mangifera indica]